MKRWLSLGAMALLIGMTVPAPAQKPVAPPPSAGKVLGGKPVHKDGGTVSYSGTVKGTPVGKTFALSLRKKMVTVDAANATFIYHNAPATMAQVRNGMFVMVVGPLTGDKLTAKKVTIVRMVGDRLPISAQKALHRPTQMTPPHGNPPGKP